MAAVAKSGCPYCSGVQACTVGNGLFIAPSNIPDAGRGVFAARDFHRGDCITEYGGRLINRVQMLEMVAEKKNMWKLIVLVPEDKLFIDGEMEIKDGLPAGAFLNDARNSRVENVEFARDPEDFRLWVVAKRFIKAGEELFVEYGRNYWFEWQTVNKVKPKRLEVRPKPIAVPEQYKKCSIQPTRMYLDPVQEESVNHKRRHRHRHRHRDRQREKEFEEQVSE
jgi:uncharacterized protein